MLTNFVYFLLVIVSEQATEPFKAVAWPDKLFGRRNWKDCMDKMILLNQMEIRWT